MFLILVLESLLRLAITLETRDDAAILPASLFQILNKQLLKDQQNTTTEKIKVATVLVSLLLTIVHWDSKMFFLTRLFKQLFQPNGKNT